MSDRVTCIHLVLEQLWAVRECFVCYGLGRCNHREPEADLAWVEAQMRRLASAASPDEMSKESEQNLWLPGLAPGEESVRVH